MVRRDHLREKLRSVKSPYHRFKPSAFNSRRKHSRRTVISRGANVCHTVLLRLAFERDVDFACRAARAKGARQEEDTKATGLLALELALCDGFGDDAPAFRGSCAQRFDLLLLSFGCVGKN